MPEPDCYISVYADWIKTIPTFAYAEEVEQGVAEYSYLDKLLMRVTFPVFEDTHTSDQARFTVELTVSLQMIQALYQHWKAGHPDKD